MRPHPTPPGRRARRRALAAALTLSASVAALPYSHEVVAKVTNLRDFFVTLFFVALGMGIPVPKDSTALVFALVLALVAVVLRYVVFLPLLYLAGVDNAFRSVRITGTGSALACRDRNFRSYCVILNESKPRLEGLLSGAISSIRVY